MLIPHTSQHGQANLLEVTSTLKNNLRSQAVFAAGRLPMNVARHRNP